MPRLPSMTHKRIIEAVNPLGWAVVILAIGLWELLIDTKVIDFQYMPPPSDIVTGFRELVSSGEMGRAVLHTTESALLSSAIGMLIGIALGAAVGLLNGVRIYTSGSIDVLRTVPTVALMPVALLVWGAGMKSEIIVATYAATWPMLINTAAGVRGVHPVKRDVARTFRLSRPDVLRKVVFPVATPAILVGARLAVVNALVVAIVAEMLISPYGIGYGLVFAQQSLHPEQMWAYAVVAGIIGYLANVALMQMVRRGGANMGAQDS